MPDELDGGGGWADLREPLPRAETHLRCKEGGEEGGERAGKGQGKVGDCREATTLHWK